MGFQLTISEGKEAGREFVFEQPSVVIGRSSDCDVVLYDPGVSRKHARIYCEGEAFFVEDMGSSNGTKINGALVKKHQLSDGDNIALGPVVFSFMWTVVEPPTGENDVGVADQSTRIVSVDAVKRTRGKGAALAPTNADAEQLQQLTRSRTTTMQAVSRPRSSNPQARSPAAAPLAPARPDRERASNLATGSRAAGTARGGLSAAERARIRRESPGLVGTLKLFWLDASDRTRKLIFAGAGVLGLALVGLVAFLILDDGPGPKKVAEPDVLTRTPIEQSFGLGEGVDFERPDMKVFEFEYLSPTAAVAILTYQALNISQGEVAIIVNGQELATVPPDTLGSNDKLLEVYIPPSTLKRGEKNQVIFDNTRNPPGEDTWKIWNVRIDPVPLPEGTPEELLASAKASFERAVRNAERESIGASNLYEAWKDFRNAWLSLELVEPKPELYLLARDKMKETQAKLDRKCAQLMLEVETFYNQKNWDAARATLDHVKEYFPNENDQLCPRKAEQKRYEYGL